MTATPSDLPALIVVSLLTIEVVRRLPTALRNPRSRTLWFVFFTLDVAMATKIHVVGDFLYRLTGVDDVATLAKHIVGIAAVAGLLRWVSSVVPGRMDGKREPAYRLAIASAPRRIVTWAAVVIIAAIFPLAQRREGNQEDTDFIFVQAGHFWGSLHMLLFYAYLVFGLTCGSMMCAAASRERTAHGAWKYGMQALSVGATVGAFYGVLRSGYLIARLFDKPFLGGDVFVNVASSFSLVICIILVVCGAAAPKWEAAGHLTKSHRAINDLRPLWARLTEAVPSVIYDGQPRRTGIAGQAHDFWNWKNLDLRLRRRVNEICDASLVLASYVPPGLRERTETAVRELRLPQHVTIAYLLHTAMRRQQNHEDTFDDQPGSLLTAGRDLLGTAEAMLPVSKALADGATMQRIDALVRTEVSA